VTQAATEDTVSYWNAGVPVELIVSLDSLGIVPSSLAQEAEVRAALTNGLVWVRSVGGGPHVVARSDHAAGRGEIFEQAARLREAAPSVIAAAGALARYRESDDWPVVVTGEIVVWWRSAAEPTLIDAVRRDRGLELVRTGRAVVSMHVYRVTEASPGDVLTVTESLLAHPAVESAYPNLVSARESTARRADGLVGAQWHLSNAADHDINAPEAWALETGSSAVTIAIIDNGTFDTSHPDLAANLWTHPSEPTEHGWNYRDNCNGTVCGTDVATAGSFRWHGTAAAGLAAGATGAGEVKGVCPDCTIMLLVTPGDGASRRDAFVYAKKNGASVVSASWDFKLGTFQPLEAAIKDVATQGRGGLGVPVFMAAGLYDVEVDECTGNDRTGAAMPEVVSVSVSNELDQRQPLYGHGDCLDLLAPGATTDSAGVLTSDEMGSAGKNDNPFLRCWADSVMVIPLDYTACFEGSSAATPIAAGVAGLMLSARPSLTAAEVRDIMVRTANKVECALPPPDPYVPSCADPYAHSVTHGYGRVDAHAAVTEALASPPTGAPPPEEGGPTGLEIGVRAGWTDIDGGNLSDLALPGSGPAAVPVLHLTWFIGTPTAPSPWTLELQLGARRTVTGSTTTSAVAAALQAGFLLATGSTAPYVAAGFAGRKLGTAYDSAPGFALGLWKEVAPYAAIRVEGRARYWLSASDLELGLAFGGGFLVH
jgi:subtilisin family serine protease